jgi:magnesium transporter
MPRATWVDLLDPNREELEKHLPKKLHESAIEQLLTPAEHDDEPRPTLHAHGDYVFGVFLVAVAVADEDRVFYQEIDIVLTADFLLTVRKTPPGEEPYDIDRVRAICPEGEEPEAGMILYHLVDDVAERYLDLIDAVNDEIDELEDHVEAWPNEKVRQRLSDLRHDLLHIRRTLSPTRDAVRRIVDGRLELEEGAEAFPREVELHFADAYDKLLRSSEGLELSRDLVASARDYHQAKVANDQNEVVKRLTAIASILLVPTFIVGLYGQNFIRSMPELRWGFGYWWSWGWIIVTTVAQVIYFRRKGWI